MKANYAHHILYDHTRHLLDGCHGRVQSEAMGLFHACEKLMNLKGSDSNP